MKIDPKINVGQLCDRYQVAEEVLSEYGVEFVEEDFDVQLAELCSFYDLDIRDVIRDIRSAILEEELD